MRVESLILELTRQCNMKCGHCLRGDAQNLNMDVREVVTALRDNDIEEVGCLTLTGGEVSLFPAMIELVREAIAYLKFDVDYFYVVTNAKKYSEKFATALDHLAWHTNEDWNVLSVSKSKYHGYEGQDDTVGRRYEERFEEQDVRVSIEYRADLSDGQLLNMGRAKENQLRGGMKEPEMWDMKIKGDQIEELYVAANGDIIPSCDLSYEEADRVKLGNILTTKLADMMPVVPDEFQPVMATEAELQLSLEVA